MTSTLIPRIDLKFKIFFFNLVLVFAVMAYITAVDMQRISRFAEERLENKTQTIARVMEPILYTALIQNDQPGLDTIVKRITSLEIPENDIIYATIMDKENRKLALSDQTFSGKLKENLARQATLPGIRQPIRSPGGEVLGFLQMNFSLEWVARKQNETVRGNLLIAIVLSVCAFLWSVILANIINRPLKSILEAADRISKGDLETQIEEQPQDEIGVLISCFNRMTETIGLHLEEMRQKNQQLEKRVFELSTLHQAARAINSVLNLDQLYERIVDTTISVLGGVKRCSLMLADKRTNEFVIKVAKGLDIAVLPSSRRVPIVNGVAGKVFQEGEPVLLNDLNDGDNTNVLASAQVVRSSVCVPLRGSEEILGVISASNKISGEAFTSNDVLLLETLATQAGIAIKNAKLYQDLRRKILELNTLHEVGKTLSMVLEIERLLELIIDMTTRVLGGVKASSIILHDQETNKLQVKVYKGFNRELAMKPIEIGEGIAGKVFEKGEPMMINNLPGNPPIRESGANAPGSTSPAPSEAGESGQASQKSSLCVPLKIKERVIGVLSVSDKLSGESFDENDLHMLVTLASQIAITLNNAQLYEDLEASYLAAVRALANSLDAKDKYTRGHSERVALYSLEIGKAMKLPPESLKNLHIGALLHDIGKIGISEVIITKPTRLTEEEYELVKMHPVRGAKIIEPAKFLKEKVPLIKFHHERMDGKGYPEGLKGDNIPLLARIVCVADSFDAMTSKRAYRAPMGREAAVQELVKFSGSQFDPRVVSAFLEILGDEKKLAEIQKTGQE